MRFENTECSLFAQFRNTSSLRQRIWTLKAAAPPQRRWITHNTTHRCRVTMAGPPAYQEDQITPAPGKSNTWRLRDSPPRCAVSAKQASDLATMGSHSSVAVLGFMISFSIGLLASVMPSQGSTKALYKNSHSLWKLHSSGLFWPAMPVLFFPRLWAQHRTLKR